MKRTARAIAAAIACVAWWLVCLTYPVESHNPITTTVTFDREVTTILNSKCAQCHRLHGMAISLQTYSDARPWAVAIKEEILAKRMPPWPADRSYGARFANDGGLTSRERDFLISWIDGGAPQGEGDGQPYADHSGHWMRGAPDIVLTRASETESRSARHRRFIMRSLLQGPTWVRALDFRPNDPFVRAAFFSIAETNEYLGGWTPWHSTTELPANAAWLLPANAEIAVDVHYGGMAPTTARPELALYFGSGRPNRVTNVQLTRVREPRHGRLRAEYRLRRRATLLSIRIEESTENSAIEVRAIRPDRTIEPLLLVPRFSRLWQTPYVLQPSLPLPSGSIIEAIARVNEADGTPLSLVVQAQLYPTGRSNEVTTRSSVSAHVHSTQADSQ